MFKIRAFDKDKDKHIIDKWCLDWKIDAFKIWFLPEENFIIDDVIFASFYKTDSKVAYMENVLGNRECAKDVRQAALGELGVFIFDRARELGFKVVLGWTSNKSVSATSAKHGMILTEFNHAGMIKIL